MTGKNRFKHASKIITFTLAAGILLELIYLAAANFLLMSGSLERILNRKPEKALYAWTSAWTVWPGIVHVHHFSLAQKNRRTRWNLELDRASLQIHLRELCFRRFTAENVSIRGATLQIETVNQVRSVPAEVQPVPKDPTDTAISEIPPTQTGANPPDPPVLEPAAPIENVPSSALQPPGNPPWTITIHAVHAEDLKAITFDQYTLKCTGTVNGAMTYITRGPMYATGVDFFLENGEVTADELPVASGLNIHCNDVAMGPYVPRENRGRKALAFLDGDLKLTGRIQSLGFIQHYFQNTDWIHLDGAGLVDGQIKMVRGILQPSSRFQFTPDQLTAKMNKFTVTGAGSAQGEVTEINGQSMSRLHVNLRDIQMVWPERASSPLKGPGFNIELAGPTEPLGSDLVNTTVQMNLLDCEIPDLAEYNNLLPENAGFRILETSRCLISSHLEFDGREGRCSLDVHGPDAGFQVGKIPVRGDFALHAQLQSTDPDIRMFQLTDTSIRLDNAVVNGDTDMAADPWGAQILISDTSLELDRSMKLAGDIQIHVQDSRPLNALWGTGEPKWFHDFLKINNIEGNAHLRMEGSQLTLHNVSLEGTGILPDELGMDDLQVKAVCPELNVKQGWRGLDLRLSRVKSSIRSLDVFNSYIPSNAGFVFLPRSPGAVSLDVKVDNGALSGKVEISGKNTQWSIQQEPFRGNLTLSLKIRSKKIESKTLDFSGTMMALDNIKLEDDSGEKPWQGNLRVTRGAARIGKPLNLDGDIEIQMQDSWPIVAIFERQKGLKSWAREILTVQNLQGSANIRIDNAGMRFTNLKITGEDLTILAGLYILKENTCGIFYTRFHGISLGIERNQGKTDYRFIKPRNWYNRHAPLDCR